MLGVISILYFSLYSVVTSIAPVALVQLININHNAGNIIRLRGIELTGRPLSYIITRLPLHGSLFQLSHAYSHHGYNPIQGIAILSSNVKVIDSNNRVYYSRLNNKITCSNSIVDTFSYIADNGIHHSIETNITIADMYGNIQCSDFLLNQDGWTIIGNKQIVDIPVFERFSRGIFMNHYIYATDNKINVDYYGGTDKSLWFFNAPDKFLNNIGTSYGGHLKFTLGIFAGDLTHLNYGKLYNLVELECESCGLRGIILKFPLNSKLLELSFNNGIALFQIPLSETYGWITNIYNIESIPYKPTKCEFIQVLSRLSSLRILGDITDWYETISLDNVYISNRNYNIPRCATIRPDASICTC